MISDISLYIHWPFCVSKCPYCDFNSHVFRTIEEGAWVAGITHEITRYHKMITESLGMTPPLRSVFFGGGTPSLMQGASVQHIMDTIHTLWDTTAREVTLEANPGSVESQRFNDYQKAGVNRLSLGLQSLNDAALQFLGRKHTVAESLIALETARSVFGDKVSIDLIYARPEQTLDMWQQELTTALQLDIPHMSLYQLTIEPTTAFQTLYERGDFIMPAEQEAFDFYEMTQRIMDARGYQAYEVSNYAKPSYESVHNTRYWRYQPYIGVGPGAHGRIVLKDAHGHNQKLETIQLKAPKTWLEAVQNHQSGDKSTTVLDVERQFQEHMMMGLRLNTGIALNTLPRPFTDMEKKRLDTLQRHHMAELDTDYLRLTMKGRLVLNQIIHYLEGK